MSRTVRPRSLSVIVVMALALVSGVLVQAQIGVTPYKVNYNWDKLEGRKIGVASGIRLDPDGQHLWILDRCGANGCAESTLDPIIQVDMDGKFVRSFGKGIMNFPHGFFIDREGFIWVTDGAPNGDPRGEAGFKKKLGHQIYKFSRDGKLVMTLGEAGVPGADDKHFNGPTGVVIDQAGARVYVLNKFDATISMIDAVKRVELERVSFFDPTPMAIKLGRPHLYDAHQTSGLGHISCASCHPDGRMDRLAWDLGDPAGTMIGFDQNCNFGSTALGSGPCPD